MRIKNISDDTINLASGKLGPDGCGEATVKECHVLFTSKKAVPVTSPLAASRIKTTSKTKAK